MLMKKIFSLTCTDKSFSCCGSCHPRWAYPFVADAFSRHPCRPLKATVRNILHTEAYLQVELRRITKTLEMTNGAFTLFDNEHYIFS